MNKDKAILTNIVRASLGRPLQFTDLTTVSGTASQSFSLAGVFPFAVHRPPTVGVQDTFSPTMSLSGGPTFSVANLSTKEFYSGILNAISTRQIANYLEQGYPAQILLPLVISEIAYLPKDQPIGPTDQSARIYNTVDNFENFYSALNGLIAIGLTTESVDDPMAESPTLTEMDAKDPKLLASLASGTAAGNTPLDLKRYQVIDPTNPANKDPNLLPSEYEHLKQSGNSVYFRLEKKSTKYGFCLDRAILERALMGKKLPVTVHVLYRLNNKTGRPEAVGPAILLDETDVRGANKLPSKKGGGTEPAAGPQAFKNWKFSTRSVAGVITFLGEAVRSRKPLVVSETPQGGDQKLFNAFEQLPPGPSISATVDDHTYYVDVDPYAKDMSSRTLELLAELIALNNSAKDLPAPNVITVISP